MEINTAVQKNPAGPALVTGILGILDAVFGSILFGIVGAAVAAALGIFAILRGLRAVKATRGAQGNGGVITGAAALVLALAMVFGIHMFTSGIRTAAQEAGAPILTDCADSCYYGVAGFLRKTSASDISQEALMEEIEMLSEHVREQGAAQTSS